MNHLPFTNVSCNINQPITAADYVDENGANKKEIPRNNKAEVDHRHLQAYHFDNPRTVTNG
jgi:hypothetical protein